MQQKRTRNDTEEETERKEKIKEATKANETIENGKNMVSKNNITRTGKALERVKRFLDLFKKKKKGMKL